MARKKQVYAKRIPIKDPKYDDWKITKLINYVMLDGAKTVSEKIVYSAMEIIKEKISDVSPKEVVLKALENIKPKIEVRARRVGGATYQVPREVPDWRGNSLSFRWLVNAARKRKERTMKERLAAEIMEAYNNTGNAIKKREEVYKAAEANRAFAHYRW